MTSLRKQAPFSQIALTVSVARTKLHSGASLNTVIQPSLQRLPQESRPVAQALIYESVRCHAQNSALIKQLCTRIPNQDVISLLETGLTALNTSKVSSFTIVSETVNAAKLQNTTCNASGLINAVLRRYLREKDTLLANVAKNEEVRYNLPRWWIDYIRHCYPQQAEQILSLGIQHPPLTLRVNVQQTDLTTYTSLLREKNISFRQVGLEAIELLDPMPVEQIPGFIDGLCSVQDAGTQLAAHLLPVKKGDRVLDACAAPGGKTAHLLEKYQCNMTALEIDPVRTAKIQENLDRLQLQAKVITANANELSTWWDGQLFDAILLDAPCTASGVVRRQPDTPWLRRRQDIKNLAAEQFKLLTNLWPLLKPNGKLLYATCSIFPEEGTQQIQKFLSKNDDAILVPLFAGNTGMLTLLPEEKPTYTMPDLLPAVHDGFFYALLEKKA